MHLISAGILQDFQDSIFKLVQDKKYQSACEMYFLGRLRIKEEKKKLFCKSRPQPSEEACDVEGLCTESYCNRGCCEKVIIDKHFRSGTGIIQNESKNEAYHEESKRAKFADGKEGMSQKVHSHEEILDFSSKPPQTSETNNTEHMEAEEIASNSSESKTRAEHEVRCDDDSLSSNNSYDVNIEKPSDYFFSYRQLLRSLQSMK